MLAILEVHKRIMIVLSSLSNQPRTANAEIISLRNTKDHLKLLPLRPKKNPHQSVTQDRKHVHQAESCSFFHSPIGEVHPRTHASYRDSKAVTTNEIRFLGTDSEGVTSAPRPSGVKETLGPRPVHGSSCCNVHFIMLQRGVEVIDVGCFSILDQAPVFADELVDTSLYVSIRADRIT